MKWTAQKMMRLGFQMSVPVVALTISAGCASARKDTLSVRQGAVTDVTPMSPAVSYQPMSTGAAVQPIQPVNEATLSSGVSVPVASASGAAGSIYIVKKGDTLYKIAREHYGDPKAWQKIASANPAAAGGTIKTGQKLVLP